MAANNWPSSSFNSPLNLHPTVSQEPSVRMRQQLPGAANMGIDNSQPVRETSQMASETSRVVSKISETVGEIRKMASETQKMANETQGMANEIHEMASDIRQMGNETSEILTTTRKEIGEGFGGIQKAIHEGFAATRKDIEEMTRMSQQFGAQLRAVDIQSRARGKNSVVRMSNSKAAIQSSSKLEPLVSVRTGEIIEGFPTTPGRISALEENQANRILYELGITMEDVPLVDKYQQIELCWGLVKEAI